MWQTPEVEIIVCDSSNDKARGIFGEVDIVNNQVACDRISCC